MATRQELIKLSQDTFFDNITGEIEPGKHREFNEAMIQGMTHPSDLTPYAKKTDLTGLAKTTDLNNYVTKTEFNNAIGTISSLTDSINREVI